MTPARDTGSGRPYIREVAGRMTLADVRISALGFWSGRTGGVAWTGLATHPSYGGASSSTFTGNTYGAFVTRGHDVRFLYDLFESNQLDGLHIHRGTVGASASYSAAVRNGGNGFHVDRAAQKTVLLHDVSEHNATNGFLIDGLPAGQHRVSGRGRVTPGSGTRVEYSDALRNGRTGILVEGGNETVLKADEVCARQTGIALRYGASNAIVDGNDVRCDPRTGLSVGPAASGALLYGNAVSGARIAILVSSSGSVVMDKSLITLASVFGVSARGANSVVTGKDNVISGIGFRAVDASADAATPALSGSNTADWAYARRGTVLSYLEFHPLALLWLSIGFVVVAGGLWTRRRRAPSHPYPESTRWTGSVDDRGPAPVGVAAAPAAASGAAQAGPAWSPGHDAWPDEAAPYRRGAFEPALPEVARRNGAWLDASRPDAARPGGRRPQDASRLGLELDAARFDHPLGDLRGDGRRGDAPRVNGRGRDGERYDDLTGDPLLDAPGLDGRGLDGRGQGDSRQDGQRRTARRDDSSPREPQRLGAARRVDRLKDARRGAARRGAARRGAARLDAAGPDARHLEDARPHVGSPDGHRQPSRHGRSEPADSTKPLPPAGERS